MAKVKESGIFIFHLESFYDDLEYYMESNEITKKGFSLSCGCSPSYFKNILFRKQIPGAFIFLLICKVMGEDPFSYLFKKDNG